MSSVSSSKSRPSTVNRASFAVGRGDSEAPVRTDKPPRSAGPHPKRTKKPSKASADQLRAKEEEYM